MDLGGYSLNEIKNGYLKIKDSSLFYSVKGEGEALVFIHGNFNDSRVWDYQIDSFTDHYKVIWYDQRGYGKSDAPIATFSHFGDLKALLDSLGIKKVSMIGSSSGGSIAVDFALRYPAFVKAMVLVSPAINGYRYPIRLMVEAMKNIFLLKSKGHKVAIEKFIHNPFWEYFFPPQNKQEAREKVLEMVRTQRNFYSWDFKLAISEKPYASKRLKEVKVPTLIVLSDMDAVFNIKVGEYIHKGIKNSKKVIISGCRHLPFIEKPSEFNEKVLDFLKEA